MCYSASLHSARSPHLDAHIRQTMIASPEKSPGSSSAILYARYAEHNHRVKHLTFDWPHRSLLPVLGDPVEQFDRASRILLRLGPSRRDRLIRTLKMLQARSYFTGIGGFECVLHAIINCVNKQIEEPLDYIECTNATEMAPSRQKVLQKCSVGRGPHCEHDWMEERLPGDTCKYIQTTLPGTKDCDDAKRLAYQKIEKVVANVYKHGMDECLEAPCVTHGKSRPVIGRHRKNMWTAVGSGVVCKDASRIGSRRVDA